MIGFYMIATKVDTVYSVSMPADVRALMEQLSVVVSLGMGGVATTPLECMGLSGYVPRLIFYIIFPMVLTAILMGAVCLSLSLKKRKVAKNIILSKGESSTEEDHVNRFNLDDGSEGPEVGSTLVENALPPFLQIMFLLYPLGECTQRLCTLASRQPTGQYHICDPPM